MAQPCCSPALGPGGHRRPLVSGGPGLGGSGETRVTLDRHSAPSLELGEGAEPGGWCLLEQLGWGETGASTSAAGWAQTPPHGLHHVPGHLHSKATRWTWGLIFRVSRP